MEVKELLKKKQDNDEARVIKHLAEEDGIQSVASTIYKTWNLDRRQIKECHIAMRRDRQLQVTFHNIVVATRFKTFDGQHLMRAKCQRSGCGMVDSWEHSRERYEIPDISELKGQAKTEKLANICKKTKERNPVRPRPSQVEYAATTDPVSSDPQTEARIR